MNDQKTGKKHEEKVATSRPSRDKRRGGDEDRLETAVVDF
jgi:hypothetical protein